MLTLYIYHDNGDVETIREELRSRALRFRELPLEHEGEPSLVDTHINAHGITAIFDALDELDAFSAEWYKFQSDSCYMDVDGSNC